MFFILLKAACSSCWDISGIYFQVAYSRTWNFLGMFKRGVEIGENIFNVIGNTPIIWDNVTLLVIYFIMR